MVFEIEREQMVEFQLRLRGIDNKKIIDAFLEIPREKFVLPELKKYAYMDNPLPIGYDQTISQPYIVALMIELLEPKRNDVVLEIGAGSGYSAAILSKIARKVVSLELIQELASFARHNLKKIGIDNVEVFHFDGTNKLNDKKFDKIIVPAALKDIPDCWIEELNEGGILIAPIGDKYSQKLIKYRKTNDELELVEESIDVLFVPLKKNYS